MYVTFLVPAHSGSPGKRAVERVCVCGIHVGRFDCNCNKMYTGRMYNLQSFEQFTLMKCENTQLAETLYILSEKELFVINYNPNVIHVI